MNHQGVDDSIRDIGAARIVRDIAPNAIEIAFGVMRNAKALHLVRDRFVEARCRRPAAFTSAARLLIVLAV
jgi:hypothetical protein